MLAYLLASLAKCMAMTTGSNEHCLGERCFGMQRTDAASKKQMLAYLLASLAKCMAMTTGSNEHCLGERCFGMQRTDAASKKQMLAYLLASLAKCMAMTILESACWHEKYRCDIQKANAAQTT